MSRNSHPLVLAILLVTFLAPLTNAQERKKPASSPIREQTIYIPFEKLKDVFEKRGRGIFLPYEKFQELWKKARQATVPIKPRGAPVGSLVREMHTGGLRSKYFCALVWFVRCAHGVVCVCVFAFVRRIRAADPAVK